jgi:crotonobetainyl-CoA:carnitine CoA-transferase CaiB-like acyl-CoA transferase
MADEKAELCGRLLADLGADVVRIEPPGGARSRRMPPFAGDFSLYFAVRNANKRGLTLDLSRREDQEQLLSLLGGADIWIETGAPGALCQIGLDPEDIAKRIPHLVVISVTDFGQTGPYSGFQATDPVMEAMAWMLFRAGVPELPPVLPPGAIAYDIAGVSAAFAVLTAYLDRRGTGAGQYIDMSVMEAVAQTTDWGLTSYSVISKMGIYGEVRDGGGKTYPVLPCRDGYVRLGLVTTSEWHKLRAWIGQSRLGPDISAHDYWDDPRARIELFDDLLRPVVIEFFKDRSMMDLSIEGQERGMPITPMLAPGDVLRAEHFAVLGSFTDAEVGPEGVGRIGRIGRIASGFLVADGERIGYRSPAPSTHEAPPDDDPEWAPRRAGRVAGSQDGDTSAIRPYSGLRVIEFGVAGAVPEIARLLAEQGADAIRVESPRRLDLFRQLSGPTGVGGVFASSNRSTRSFGVDFTEPAGAEIAKELLATADVVLENMAPGTLERCGLGPDVIRAINRDALLISSQAMGRRGPWAHWRGYGSNTQLTGGMSWLWTLPDTPEPVPQNVAFPDHLVGRLGATVVAADIIGRLGGERGAAHVEIVQAEMALNLLADLFVKESLEPGSVRPLGNRSSRGVPWGVYPCAGQQRWCVITCCDDRQWLGLIRAMGNPDWALSPNLDDLPGRLAAQDAIDEHVSAWTRERSDRDVMEVLQAHGVPAGKMMYISDQPDDPHLKERGYILEMEQPGVGPLLLEGPAFRATRLSAPITLPAPRLGQHTRQIAREILGYSNERVDALLASGVLIDAPTEGLDSLPPRRG